LISKSGSPWPSTRTLIRQPPATTLREMIE
jgi:hypothetical protein